MKTAKGEKKYPLETLAMKRNMTVGDVVREALEANNWHREDTARVLKVTRQALYNAMIAWNIPSKNPNKVKL